ncbi:YtzC family protein [Pallidibacillus thermolactis]|jgi:hypothetical protein|uniref:YtzC family protein n=1 Tax=Pallidibacillus thermolactis TaxID=251051 RepID=UPI00156B9B1C|nr:YtzC family protein [Pallidibacillus thermolactis]MCU9601084.1 YtzC family protein [Pallidibacillus thermolactis subsp. kokeshiiformis]MED1672747.1 YtzC family protein [Pallidibacillus thermolactis subsp. kokeshiiformis]
MTTRESLERFISECQQTMDYARAHLIEGSRQQHYDDVGYTNAQLELEECYNELMKLYQSANAQQREQLHRLRLQIQALQNEMTLLEH